MITRQHESFTRSFHIADAGANGAARVKVIAEVEWRDGRLSFTGAEGPKRNGDAVGSSGQIIMTWSEDPTRWTPTGDFSAEQLQRFMKLWDRWHLNDMQAGSPRQRAWLEANPVKAESHYDKACEALAAVGLHPDTEYVVNDKPYKYGSAWLTEEVPVDVLDEIRSFPFLKETT